MHYANQVRVVASAESIQNMETWVRFTNPAGRELIHPSGWELLLCWGRCPTANLQVSELVHATMLRPSPVDYIVVLHCATSADAEALALHLASQGLVVNQPAAELAVAKRFYRQKGRTAPVARWRAGAADCEVGILFGAFADLNLSLDWGDFVDPAGAGLFIMPRLNPQPRALELPELHAPEVVAARLLAVDAGYRLSLTCTSPAAAWRLAAHLNRTRRNRAALLAPGGLPDAGLLPDAGVDDGALVPGLQTELLDKGLVTPAFAARYGLYFDHRWLALTKLSVNPLWERLPAALAAELYLGTSPQQLAADRAGLLFATGGFQLTRTEAHAWLQALAALDSPSQQFLLTPLRFFADRFGITAADLARFVNPTRALLMWYARKQHNPAMTKVRIVHGPGGAERRFAFNELLDELCEADLCLDGPGLARLCMDRAPEQVFESAARRRQQQYLQRHTTSRELPQAQLLPDPDGQVRPIFTTRELIEEGERMNHCVGGYANACLAGRSFIFVVLTPEGRSTLELVPHNGHYRLTQHLAADNFTPAGANHAAAARWCAHNGIHHPQHAAASAMAA